VGGNSEEVKKDGSCALFLRNLTLTIELIELVILDTHAIRLDVPREGASRTEELVCGIQHFVKRAVQRLRL
jgi:hypothetical protein